MSRVTFAVRPMSVSTPSSCSGVRLVRCLVAIGRHRQQQRRDRDECDELEGRRAAEEGDGHAPSAPPANISRTRSRLTTSPAANRPAAISQSNQAAMIEVSQTVPPMGIAFRSRCRHRSDGPRRPAAPDRHGHRRSLAGARLPGGRFAVDDGLAERPHVLRRGARRRRRRPRAFGERPAGYPRAGSAGVGADRAAGLGERRFRLVLPAPGDVRGLPRVPGLAPLALEAGQAAVGDRLALVPEAVGRRPSPGRRSQWTPPMPLPAGGGNAACGVRSPRPGRRGRRAHPRPPRRRPLEPRGALVAGRAARHPPPRAARRSRPAGGVGARARAAAGAGARPRDGRRAGAAVNHAQAAARDSALRPLADAVREAVTAAYNTVPR